MSRSNSRSQLSSRLSFEDKLVVIIQTPGRVMQGLSGVIFDKRTLGRSDSRNTIYETPKRSKDIEIEQLNVGKKEISKMKSRNRTVRKSVSRRSVTQENVFAKTFSSKKLLKQPPQRQSKEPSKRQSKQSSIKLQQEKTLRNTKVKKIDTQDADVKTKKLLNEIKMIESDDHEQSEKQQENVKQQECVKLRVEECGLVKFAEPCVDGSKCNNSFAKNNVKLTFNMLFIMKRRRCYICSVIVYDELALTNCLHVFCTNCLHQWVKFSCHCSQCKQQFNEVAFVPGNENLTKDIEIGDDVEEIDSYSTALLFDAYKLNLANYKWYVKKYENDKKELELVQEYRRANHCDEQFCDKIQCLFIKLAQSRNKIVKIQSAEQRIKKMVNENLYKFWQERCFNVF